MWLRHCGILAAADETMQLFHARRYDLRRTASQLVYVIAARIVTQHRTGLLTH
jgi:1,2-phenylacetyl-CoA epoxidase PaaB subunit